MSSIGERVMPHYTARPVLYGIGVHWTVDLPEGTVTYPSQTALLRGLARIGATATFSDEPIVSPLRTPRSTTHAVGAAAASSSRPPDGAADPSLGAGATSQRGGRARRVRAGNSRASGTTPERA